MGRQGPVLFYEAGNTPILWVHQESPPLSTFIFRPSDVALRSLGMNLINKLPKELQQSHEVLVATNGAVIAELDTDPNLAEIVKTLTEPAVSKG